MLFVKKSLQKPFFGEQGLFKIENCTVNKKLPPSAFLSLLLLSTLLLTRAHFFMWRGVKLEVSVI